MTFRAPLGLTLCVLQVGLAAYPLSARGEEAGRGALAIGAAALRGGPADLSGVGLHVGWESAYHFGFLGPMLSFDVDRFGAALAGGAASTLVSMGAGVRMFLFHTRLAPFAVYLDGQAVVAGATSPLGMGGERSFLGATGGGGVEWVGGLPISLAAQYVYLGDGPELFTLALAIALGAP